MPHAQVTASWPPMLPAGTAVAVCASTPSPNNISSVVPANSAQSSALDNAGVRMPRLHPLDDIGDEAVPRVDAVNRPGDRLGGQVDVPFGGGVVRDRSAQHRLPAPAGAAQHTGAVGDDLVEHGPDQLLRVVHRVGVGSDVDHELVVDYRVGD